MEGETVEQLRDQLEAMKGTRPDWRRRMQAADQIVARLLNTQGAAIARARRSTRVAAVA